MAMYQHPLLMVPRRDSDSECENVCQSALQCSVPNGECLMSNVLSFGIISYDNLQNAVRVICTNENCTSGQYMHQECFEQWEKSIMNYVKNYSLSDASSSSSSFGSESLWSGKYFDLFAKACTCRCGRGYVKKDLNWVSNSPILRSRNDNDSSLKKKKKKTRKNCNNLLATSSLMSDECSPTLKSHIMKLSPNIVDNMCSLLDQQLSVSTPMHSSIVRRRAGSLTSSNSGSSSPASSTNGESITSISPVQNSNDSSSNFLTGNNYGRFNVKRTYADQNELYSERIR